MRKVILVDDEMFARKGLVGLIPWENYGFEVVGEAEDGEEALALIEQTEPDLVITDIRMPVLDGLELIQAVQARQGKAIRFIIISGYGDFKYAQQAVRYGVQDYLLKPIDENELVDSLVRIGELLRKEQPRMDAGNALLHASLFEKLLSGRAEEASIHEAANTFGLPERLSLRYIVVELNDVRGEANDAERIERTERAMRAISRVLTRTASRNEPYIHLRGEFELSLLVQANGNAQEARRIGEELARACGGIGNAVPKIFIGEAVPELAQVRQSYLSALEAMKHKYAKDDENVILHDDVKDSVVHYKEVDSGLFTELMERLEENDAEAMKAVTEAIFATFREQSFAFESISTAMSRCVHGATRIIQTMQGDEKKLASLKPMLEWTTEPRTLRGLRELLLGFLTESAKYISELRGMIGKGDIGKIKAYIENHYNENISLKSIAERFYMNSVYLGQLFKKSYGVYFNEFLLQLRIHEAKRQLRQTDKKVYEIASSVGFSNADYFVTQFEKVERKTPTEYKNALFQKN
ncbi:response regulator transcription factor [Paenibacillus sp. PR3]|uniref:Response regulator transcription factor n=1 Tax=Paenibacillus terricola TaxID=2763503 RepID=A0ABR8N0R3_9BACL|nr:response regulator transcription factor [Paenibacillus terricola]MBD3921782.1 response regulator transcription factor [Paenibacillus terricola]